MEDSKLLINRAKAIAAMGLVQRDYDGFNVVLPGIKKETFRIWRGEDGRVMCNCAEFQERFEKEPRFRCEHIFAVKFHLEPPETQAQVEFSETGKTEVEEAAPDAPPKDNQTIPLPFSETLKELSRAVVPELVRQRVGWRDRLGREHEVDYVEWHAVADLLDRICPDWSHQVNQI